MTRNAPMVRRVQDHPPCALEQYGHVPPERFPVKRRLAGATLYSGREPFENALGSRIMRPSRSPVAQWPQSRLARWANIRLRSTLQLVPVSSLFVLMFLQDRDGRRII